MLLFYNLFVWLIGFGLSYSIIVCQSYFDKFYQVNLVVVWPMIWRPFKHLDSFMWDWLKQFRLLYVIFSAVEWYQPHWSYYETNFLSNNLSLIVYDFYISMMVRVYFQLHFEINIVYLINHIILFWAKITKIYSFQVIVHSFKRNICHFCYTIHASHGLPTSILNI